MDIPITHGGNGGLHTETRVPTAVVHRQLVSRNLVRHGPLSARSLDRRATREMPQPLRGPGVNTDTRNARCDQPVAEEVDYQRIDYPSSPGNSHPSCSRLKPG